MFDNRSINSAAFCALHWMSFKPHASSGESLLSIMIKYTILRRRGRLIVESATIV